MKYLLLLLPFFSFAQCPEDMFNNAVLIGNEPKEVQIGKGQHIIVLAFERSDASTVETWVVMKKGTTVPEPEPPKTITIEAESATSIVNAAIVGHIVGNMRGDLPGGVVIKYPAVNMTGKTKVKFMYSNGYERTGTMIFKIGTTSHTFKFPKTGGWGTYKEIEFPVSGSGAIEITSSEIGSCNYDSFTFY